MLARERMSHTRTAESRPPVTRTSRVGWRLETELVDDRQSVNSLETVDTGKVAVVMTNDLVGLEVPALDHLMG